MNIFASDILFYVFGALAVIMSLLVVFMRNPVSSAMMMAISFGATAALMIGLGAHFLGILQILVYAGAIMVLFTFIIMLLNVKKETSPFKRPASLAAGIIIASLFLGQLIGIIYSLPGAKEQGHYCPMTNVCQAWDDLKTEHNPQAGEKDMDALLNNRQGEYLRYGGPITSKTDLDALLNRANAHPPAIILPPLHPASSDWLYPEGSNIRKEIDNGEFPDTALLGRTLFDKYNRTLILAGLALLVSSIGVVVLSRRPSGK